MRYLFLSIVSILYSVTLCAQPTNWYVSPDGTNNLTSGNGASPSLPLQTIQYAVNTAWNPGDTIFVMNGTYRNNGYGSGSLSNGAVVSLNGNNVAGTENGWLIITNYPGHSPKIQFDGAGGFIGNNQSYLEISGFEIEGPNQQITHTEALANRLIHDKYFSGRGIAIWSGHHIYVHHNKVHDCPNSGIRMNNGDYCTVDNNEVYNNTWWSSSAESAIVFATAMAIDTRDTIKMIMTNNLVYDNYNTIPFYNGTPVGGGSDYGTVDQDYIIDGSGCYVTRNKDTYFHGWFYFANNISYGNGINGLVVHKTNRAYVINNTTFKNGATPLSMGRQSSSGITVNASASVRMHNNISWPKYSSDFGYKIFNAGSSGDLIASNNILASGRSDLAANQYSLVNPQFVDTLNRDFHLTATSPAIDAGINHPHMALFDFEGKRRDALSPDLGALEWKAALSNTADVSAKLVVYPNPSKDYLILEGERKEWNSIGLYTLQGIDLWSEHLVSDSSPTRLRLDIQSLPSGIYFLTTSNTIHKIYKL
ncbi:MAG: T9SS type A sorting domain-containing protein [Bacteroidota bacterium]